MPASCLVTCMEDIEYFYDCALNVCSGSHKITFFESNILSIRADVELIGFCVCSVLTCVVSAYVGFWEIHNAAVLNTVAVSAQDYGMHATYLCTG